MCTAYMHVLIKKVDVRIHTVCTCLSICRFTSLSIYHLSTCFSHFQIHVSCMQLFMFLFKYVNMFHLTDARLDGFGKFGWCALLSIDTHTIF